MHPRIFLDGFWRNDMMPEVFVAMSFNSRYGERWLRVFKPAIEELPFNGVSLSAVRVDIRRSGDSILSEINNGIAHSQLILADISVTDRWEDGGERRWSRNGNVMYEVGLALACRQPVEVILVRDDDEPLLFDVSHIPVLKIDKNETVATVDLIRAAISDRLKERDLVKDLRVRAIVDSLSQFEVNLIKANSHLDVLSWQGPSLPAAVAMSLPTLLQKRVVRLLKPAAGQQPHLYTWTTLGKVVARLL